MEASVRYPELFLPPEERIPESFWISLRYFNFYRIALAAVFLGTALFYEDAVNLGTYSLQLFRYVAGAYLLCGALFYGVLRYGVLRDLRDKFELQLTLQVGVDILAITLLMYASGGIRSGLGVMLFISLTGAAILGPRRLSLLYAAVAGLAQRVAANEALARQRGRSLATQMRVNQLVIQDMHDGVVVLDREGRVVQHNPQAQRLLGGERLLGRPMGEILPGFGAATDFEVRGRNLGVRMLDSGA